MILKFSSTTDLYSFIVDCSPFDFKNEIWSKYISGYILNIPNLSDDLVKRACERYYAQIF